MSSLEATLLLAMNHGMRHARASVDAGREVVAPTVSRFTRVLLQPEVGC
ncbi:MAG: hypothetical protein AVDCRST_MAG93-8651 [uncultured Chloroflexia bacterium]|uniref:Uncharacterized protein n=1 Tax=uncultured Chloroflexia bacterium TaxID=1672391 RepID=A0A6J4N0E2_9CHLR|nr:MAG: hypothetical protein AVDCRST_MAG93-8651 [uncultured Chloroflexia bacterium]